MMRRKQGCNKCRKRLINEMFVTYKSKFGFVETVQEIKNTGVDFGWYAPEISNYYEIDEIFGIKSPNKIVSISMRVPRYAHEILKENTKLAAILPLQINVYEESSQVYVSWLNIEELGKLYSGVIAKILNEISSVLMGVHKNIIKHY